MAKLEDITFEKTNSHLVFTLSESVFRKENFAWIHSDISLMANKFPTIHFSSDGQLFEEIKQFIQNINSLRNGEINSLEFLPTVNEFKMQIDKFGYLESISDLVYEVRIICYTGEVDKEIGITAGIGMALIVNDFSLKKFVLDLGRELRKIEREFQIKAGKFMVNSVPYKESN